MLNDRRRRVLQALVEEYIASAVPVGSRTLVDRYGLGCSPATVRSELSILEETGYVVQPHVSAGRIPTDSGYRSFVDELLGDDIQVDEHTRTEVEVRAEELDELMRKTSAALSRLTDCLAVVLAPSESASPVRRVSVVGMGPARVLVVVVTDTGRVLDAHIDLSEPVTPDALAEGERALCATVTGKRLGEIRALREGIAPGDHLLHDLVDAVVSVLVESERDRVHHGGVPALLSQPEFSAASRVTPLIEALEDQIALLDELSDTDSTAGPVVRIGHENRSAGLGHISVVASHYGTRDTDGVIAVLGPTRMDYARAIAVVRAASQALGDALR